MDLNSEQASWEFLDWSRDDGVEIAKPEVGQAMNQQRQRRQQMPQLACPRCDSTNTKFCYYNNYSRSQPRHFCKACRRHWTKGGTLRSVPVGGGRRKKRPKPAHNPATTADISSNSGSISSSYPMQQQLVLPFDVDSNEICSFSDDPHQVLLRPTPPPHRLSEYGASAVDPNQSLPPFLPHFVGTGPTTMNPCQDIIRPFLTPSSSYHDYMGQHPVTTTENFAMPGGLKSASTWREPAASSGGMGSSLGYWAGWDDDIAGLVDPELEPSSADEGPQRPWKNKEMAGVWFRI